MLKKSTDGLLPLFCAAPVVDCCGVSSMDCLPPWWVVCHKWIDFPGACQSLDCNGGIVPLLLDTCHGSWPVDCCCGDACSWIVLVLVMV